jgi:geranylgeranyl pyrophosphate synthase
MKESFQEYCSGLKPLLDDAVAAALQGIFRDLHTGPGDVVKETFRGGKMIRGSLVCMVNESLGGSQDSAVPRSVAVELIHGATLVHDDFVDQDRTRRDKPAAWTLEGARKADLLGDVVFASAIEMMSSMGREDGLVVSRAIAQISKGAFQELIDPVELAGQVESDALSDRLYDAIIHLKTGVLFGVACELGAIAAGAERVVREAFHRYGLLIGEAYQIADDVKEIRHHLTTRSIGCRELAALAPALLHFGKNSRHVIPPMLGKGHSFLEGAILEEWEHVRQRMEQEIGKRLQGALLQVSGLFPETLEGTMIRRAPHELIEMFNDS